MANYLVTDADLTSVADAIRTKGGTSASLTFPSGFITAIQNIPSGGGALYIYDMAQVFYSITDDGTYGENVTSTINQAQDGDTITLVVAGGVTFYVEKVDGTGNVSCPNVDSFQVGGGGFPPMPVTTYIVYQFTMPSCSVVLYY